MMTFQMRWVLLAATAALVGCTSQEQIERQDAIPPYPEPYRAQLQQEFLLMADKEAAQNDHLDAKRFLARSVEAARAVTIYPHELTAYDIEPQFTDELTSARAQLMTLLDGGKLRAPKDLAKAHGAFECWLEEAEEGHQDDDLDWCRDRFIKAVKGTRREAGLDADWSLVMRSADGHVGAVELGGSDGKKTLLDKANAAGFVHERGESRDAALTRRENAKVAKDALKFLPEPAAIFTIFFASGSSALTDEARTTLAEAAADALDRPAPDVEILGFADRAGDDRTNLTLSEARAEAVRAALSGLNVPDDSFLIYARGEAGALVATGDGVAERRNRRVEVTVR